MVTVVHKDSHVSTTHRFTRPTPLLSVALRYAIHYEYTDVTMRHNDYATLLSLSLHSALMVSCAHEAYDSVIKGSYVSRCCDLSIRVDGNGYDTISYDAGVAW